MICRRPDRSVFVGITCVLSAVIWAGLTHAGSADDGSFPIAATSAREGAISVAFDGTNYLVGIQGCAGCTNGKSDAITAQLVAPSGALVGSRIAIDGFFGGSPLVAFDGTNYLLVWPSAGMPPVADINYGQFVTPSGTLLGSPFAITDPGVPFASLTYGGDKYFMTYQRQVNGVPGIYVRTISQAGAVGPETVVSAGAGEVVSNAAFDGNRFLVIWLDGSGLLKGRFAELSGAMSGSEFTIASSAPVVDFRIVQVAWDGVHYLVVWENPVAGGRELRGQLVDSSGTLAGDPTTIASAPAVAFFPFLAFDGTNFLVTWTDGRNDPDWGVYARFIATSGAPVGPEFPINTAAGNQFLSPVAFGGGKYLVAWGSGDAIDGGTTGDVWGAFVRPLDTVPPVTAPSISPPPNASGWNNTDVAVTLRSTDDVQSITYVLTGAQTGGATVPGSSTSILITAEGTTTVTFFGTDNAGNVESTRTATIKLDKTPPTLTVPASITTEVTSVSGALVSYPASAIDTVDPAPSVSCTPASGSTFAVGTTTVQCTATDHSNNTATGSFLVKVLSPAQIISNLIARVAIAGFHQGSNLLQNALRSLDRGNVGAACNQLGAFINQVQAQSGKSLPLAEATALIHSATNAKRGLGCR